MAYNQVGSPVRGDNFFGRDVFVRLVSDKLKAGHILLAAPRRFGKTSVMYRLLDHPRWNYRIVHADLEHFEEPTALLVQLIAQLAQDEKVGTTILDRLKDFSGTAQAFLKKNIKEIELFQLKLKLQDEIRPNWKEYGDVLFKYVNAAPETIIFVLDELPMMIDRMARRPERREDAKSLLRWLRSLCQTPHLTNIRFLIAGSIGIDRVLNELGEITAINHFERLRLEPFPPKTADDFIASLASDPSHIVILSPECRGKMLELIGPAVPYFLQILFSEIHKTHVQDNEPVTPDSIQQVYQCRVLGADCKSYFDHYYGRLRDYYQPHEEQAVKRILRELAVLETLNPNTCFQLYREKVVDQADEEHFSRLMTDLENDFYIRFNAEKHQFEFSCKILRDWWLRHYGMSWNV